MSWFYRLFRRSTDESTITLTGALSTTGALTSAGAVTGATCSDSSGNLARRYIFASSEIDVDGTSGATVVLTRVPVAATVLRAYYVVTEAFTTGSSITNAAIKVGYADADGTSNADVDAYVLGTTDKANGSLTTAHAANPALGVCQALTLGGAGAGALAAGKCLTATHVQSTDGTAGKIIVYVELLM